MLTAIEPKNEAERLEELNSFEILDTLSEADYDNITSIAADICMTNISLVSLVDSNRQWFKSHHGLDVSETPKQYSFCAHAINEKEDVFIVEDARKDDRFHDNPFVTSAPFVIFYAGVPLITDNGFPLGTLCVIGKEPKRLSTRQINSLKSLAKQTVNLLELRKKKRLLEEALLTLEEKNKRLEQFTYIASHDLQEPLRTIKNFIGYIDSNYQSKLDEKGKRSIEYISQASENMSLLIKELLDYSLLGKHNELTLIDTNLVVKMILKDIHLIIKETKASIQFSDLPTLKGHQTEIRLLFQNLITNAIKFTKTGIVPQINISVKEQKGFWLFAIKDNGIGIAPEYNEKVFEIFQRLHLKEKYKGSGIGLSHCKRIVELHNGKIWLESQINEGSTFYFTIPQ